MTPEQKAIEIKRIISMIETVSPDDTDTLDEINARVDCSHSEYEFEQILSRNNDGSIVYKVMCPKGYDETHCPVYSAEPFATSLDACMSIQEEGWHTYDLDQYPHSFIWKLAKTHTTEMVESPDLPTMPLAWLHAIMQTKLWEVENG